MNPVKLSSRPICEDDVARIRAVFDNRIVRYKLRGDWSTRFELPLTYLHNGTVCIDQERRTLFTQVPYHFKDEHSERYIILVGDEIATLQQQSYRRLSVVYAAKSLWSELPYLFSFTEASLQLTGNWAADSISGLSFFTEASAFTR